MKMFVVVLDVLNSLNMFECWYGPNDNNIVRYLSPEECAAVLIRQASWNLVALNIWQLIFKKKESKKQMTSEFSRQCLLSSVIVCLVFHGFSFSIAFGDKRFGGFRWSRTGTQQLSDFSDLMISGLRSSPWPKGQGLLDFEPAKYLHANLTLFRVQPR